MAHITQMDCREKNRLVLSALVLVFVLLFVGMVSAGSVTRQVSSQVSTGAQTTVQLIVDINENNGNETYYYVQEEVPNGWGVISAPGSLEIDGQNITWAFGPNPTDTTLSYMIQAPGSVGNYFFVGVYAIGNPIMQNVLGSNSIEVVVICLDQDGDDYDTCDPQGDGNPADCADNNRTINPGATEICTDGVDNNCDGLTDGEDTVTCPAPECVIDSDCNDPTDFACEYWSCEAGSCILKGNDSECANGAWCDGTEICQIGAGCVAGVAPNCNDGASCTADSCNEGSDSCSNVPNNGLCGVGEECLNEGSGYMCIFTASSICGNGAVEAGEQCDCGMDGVCNATELDLQTCVLQDYPAGGNLGCYPSTHAMNCSFNYGSCSPLPTYSNFSAGTTNFAAVPDIERVTNSILAKTGAGLINYSGSILNYSRLSLDDYVIIQPLRIGVDLTGPRMTALNFSALLGFYNVSFNNPIILRNGIACTSSVCNITNYSQGGLLSVRVTGFSVYDVAETPVCGDGTCNGGESCSTCSSDCGVCSSGGDPGGGGGGGGGGATAQCADKKDNDGDGLIDYPNDPGCDSQIDNNESSTQDNRLGVTACVEAWACTKFSECNEENIRLRSCTDENACGTEQYKPNLEESCETPSFLISRTRFDVIFAVIITALALAVLVVSVVVWMRIKRGESGSTLVVKRKELFDSMNG